MVSDGARQRDRDSTLDKVHAAPPVTAGGTVSFTGGGPRSRSMAASRRRSRQRRHAPSATVAISSGFLSGDTLNFADTATSAAATTRPAAPDAATATDSVTDYQAALQSVTYSFSGDPTDGGVDTGRTITWSVSDGVDGSAPAASSLTTTQCFCAGTRIADAGGQGAGGDTTPRATLRGLQLADGGAAPVRWLGRHTASRPVRRSVAGLADPGARRRVGGGRAAARLAGLAGPHLRVGGVLAHAAALVNGSSIVREARVPETFVYWHIELDTHALALAEGAPAESFLDAYEELAFDNRASRPAPGDTSELPYPRCKSPRQLPGDVRQALAARAASFRPADAAA